MINKIFSMIGLSMKAGKLVCGSDVCEENIKKKKARLVIIAEDASLNTKEKFKKISSEYNVDVIELGNKSDLSRAVGKADKVVFAVLDENFANSILKLSKEN